MRSVANIALNKCKTDLITCYIREVIPFEKKSFKILELLRKKYLTSEKYFKDQKRRCKIEILTTFVFYTTDLSTPT